MITTATTTTTAAPLLKDILGPQALATIADAGCAASSLFDRRTFLAVASDGIETLSIMERVRWIADALKAALPTKYSEAVAIIEAMAPRSTHGFQAMALAEFVARHGGHAFDRSMVALAELTRFGSAEFAIRPFLAREPERTLAIMLEWSRNADAHVRRLASEGSRPRLPWATRIPALTVDPTLAAAILSQLKTDPSVYVRKSVANHLNDIAKDRPEWVLDLLTTWDQDDAGTAWIVRHALRTLVKQGNPQALALIGATDGAAVEVLRFAVAPGMVRLGETIVIDAELVSTATAPQRLVVDYRLHYARAGGLRAAKVFKLKTVDLLPGARVALAIRQTIRDFSTRRHHPGSHGLDLIVNGRTMAHTAFDLVIEPATGGQG